MKKYSAIYENEQKQTRGLIPYTFKVLKVLVIECKMIINERFLKKERIKICEQEIRHYQK